MKLRVFVLALMIAGGLYAHHSLAAEYDQNKPVTLHAVFTSIDWRNPHAFLYLDVKGENGAVVKWQCELGSPNALTRAGWSPDAAKAGDELVVEGLLARDGSRTCSTRNVKFKDGRILFNQGQGPAR